MSNKARNIILTSIVVIFGAIILFSIMLASIVSKVEIDMTVESHTCTMMEQVIRTINKCPALINDEVVSQ